MIKVPFSSNYRQHTGWLFATAGPAITDWFDDFTLGYLDAILWAETDNSDDSGGRPLDANYNITDFAVSALLRAIHDCWLFQKRNAHLLIDANFLLSSNVACLPSYAGHDFWLTRQSHGAGFWDGDWEEAAGEALSDATHAFRELNVYVGDDGQLYFD
jgi:hypothetical protein